MLFVISPVRIFLNRGTAASYSISRDTAVNPKTRTLEGRINCARAVIKDAWYFLYKDRHES